MRKATLRIIAIIAVAIVATVIVAQELEEASVVRSLVLTGRRDFRKAVAKADADYFKRLAPSENRWKLGRCRAITATCKKTINSLERIAADAKRTGSDVEAALANNKIATVKEYLAKAEADMPKDTLTAKPVQAVKTLGARVRLGRNSYLVVLRKVTWDEARRMAKSHGGRLADVKSAQEMMFLRKFVHTNAWVGGLPGSDPLQWQWQDGKKIADIFWSNKPPRVESSRRVHVSSNGLGTHSDTGTHDAFVIEWGR